MNVINKSFELPDGRTVSVETGKLAKQADGSVVVRMGNTMLLATVVSAKEPREGTNFLPLSVDYQEKFASAGKIPGGFLKREGRLGDHEILISRLVDRAIRPLFPSDYRCDTQIMIQLISADDEMPDSLAALAASCALMVSDIPFAEPISEVRVARINGEFIVNPTREALEGADLDLIVAASQENILMVEGEMEECSEEDMIEAIGIGHQAIKVQCEMQLELMKAAGTEAKREHLSAESDTGLEKEIYDAVYQKAYDVAKKGINDKSKRKELFGAIKQEYLDSLPEENELDMSLVKSYLAATEKKAIREMMLNERTRLDGRQLNEIRNIWSEVDYIPSAHGSCVFTRGETQSLTTVTLGTKFDEQLIDRASEKGTKKFILHYNFPGFSTGEVKPNRGPARREIGHGNLAYRALSKVLPKDSPYTIRVVSDILESNGSSSMATVCAGSLAMMDAGLQTSAGVSGIAMGMISDPDTGKYAILSDILGDEDHLGDMDFKVTGTAKGITACQMDIKVEGLSFDILKEALLQAKDGRSHILGEMEKTLSQPNDDFKSHAPRSILIPIPKELIGAVIGPGGKVIQEMQKETGATINIEEKDGKGMVSIFATNGDSLNAAKDIINSIVAQPEVGDTYTGTVKNITAFGAFVEFMKGKEGLLHISEITWERLESMDGVLEEGEEIQVKLTEVDQRSGKFRLSRKVLLDKPEGYVERPARPPRDNNDRRGGNRNGGNDRRRN